MNRLIITVLGYDIKLIEKATQLIMKRIVDLKINFSGPVPLPTKKRTVTVLKSPHKHKKSQETFVRSLHRRKIEIEGASVNDLNELNNTSGMPSNIEFKLKTIS